MLNDIGGDVYEVDLSEIEPGNARVRLINFSPDAGAIDLLETGGDEWFSDVDLGNASDYRDIASATYSADVRGDDDRSLLTVSELPFEETRVYDVVVLGADRGRIRSNCSRWSPPSHHRAGRSWDSRDRAATPALRFVNAASDAPPADVYLNDAEIAQTSNSTAGIEILVTGAGDDLEAAPEPICGHWLRAGAAAHHQGAGRGRVRRRYRRK